MNISQSKFAFILNQSQISILNFEFEMGQAGSIEQRQSIKDVLGLKEMIVSGKSNVDAEPMSETREIIQITLRRFCDLFQEVRGWRKIKGKLTFCREKTHNVQKIILILKRRGFWGSYISYYCILQLQIASKMSNWYANSLLSHSLSHTTS